MYYYLDNDVRLPLPHPAEDVQHREAQLYLPLLLRSGERRLRPAGIQVHQVVTDVHQDVVVWVEDLFKVEQHLLKLVHVGAVRVANLCSTDVMLFRGQTLAFSISVHLSAQTPSGLHSNSIDKCTYT